MNTSDDDFGMSAIELARIASMDEAEKLSGLSKDSLRRNHREKIIDLSPRRQGMRVRHALMLDARRRSTGK